MQKENRYIYAGKEYSWFELIDMLIALEEVEEKKYPRWKRHDIEKYSFSCGVLTGILYGVKLVGNDLQDKKEYAIKEVKKCKKK